MVREDATLFGCAPVQAELISESLLQVVCGAVSQRQHPCFSELDLIWIYMHNKARYCHACVLWVLRDSKL